MAKANIEASKVLLDECDKRGIFIFSINDLHKLFFIKNRNTLNKRIKDLIKKCLLLRVCVNVYFYTNAKSPTYSILEHVAKIVIPERYFIYISLTSALYHYKMIKDNPKQLTLIIKAITGKTKMRRKIIKTIFGNIILTNTTKKIDQLQKYVINVPNHILPIATKELAFLDYQQKYYHQQKSLDILENIKF